MLAETEGPIMGERVKGRGSEDNRPVAREKREILGDGNLSNHDIAS